MGFPPSVFDRTRLDATGSSRRAPCSKGTRSPAGTQRRFRLLCGIQRHPAARFPVCFGGAPPRIPPRRRSRGEQDNAKQSRPSCNPVENAEQVRFVAGRETTRPITFPAGGRPDLGAKRSSRPPCSPPPLRLQTPAPVRSMGESGRRRRCARADFSVDISAAF